MRDGLKINEVALEAKNSNNRPAKSDVNTAETK